MLEKFGEQPMQRMMKADPALQNIEFDDSICRVTEDDFVERDRGELGAIQSVLLQGTHHQDMVDDGCDRRNEIRRRRSRVCLPINLDHPRQGERYIEDADPRVGLVLDVVRRCSLVRINAHEELAGFRELHHELAVVGDHRLHWLVVAEIPQVAEDGHEALGLEGECVDIEVCGEIRWVDDMLVFDLVREERRDDR